MQKVFLMTLLFLTFSLSALGVEVINLDKRVVDAKSAEIELKIDRLIAQPEAVLARFSPRGVSIRNKKVVGNTVEFLATKSVLGISRTVFYRGTLTLSILSESPIERCFRATQDFFGSDDLIYDNVTVMELDICALFLSESDVRATITPRLIRGANPGGLLGGIATDIIKDQVDPVIAAIKEEIEN